MFDLDLLIVTFKRTKFLYQTINSYINIKKNYNFRLVILDGAGDQHKEELEGQNLSTREMIKKYFLASITFIINNMIIMVTGQKLYLTMFIILVKQKILLLLEMMINF